MKHRKLIHEVWEDSDCDIDEETWHTEWGLCLAGPFGNWFRRSLSPRAKLFGTFEAGSPKEAMALFEDLIRARVDAGGRRLHIDGLKGLVESESEPYPDWFFEDDEEGPLLDPPHPLWDPEVDG